MTDDATAATAATPHVVVVGGGIAGLSAAFYLRDEPVRVTVLEGSPRLGGKLSASDVAGVSMDEGAEALLARRPEGIELITAVGLGGDLVPAGVTSSAIYTRGAMRSLPRRQFMGVPADPDELAATGVVSAEGVARAREEAARPAETRDMSVTEYVGSRLGVEVVDRLVDPLLGGVYAGRSEDLSFQATLAPLAAAVRKHATLTEAAASLLPPPSADNSNRPQAGNTAAGNTAAGNTAAGNTAADGAVGGSPAVGATMTDSPADGLPAGSPAAGATMTDRPADGPPAGSPAAGATTTGRPVGSAAATGGAGKPAPIFVSLTTGIGALPETVAKASGADVRTNAMVRELKRTQTGWRLTIGSAADPEYLDADAVILAVPAAPAARLLKDTATEAAARLAEIPYASMAIVTLAFRAADFPAQQRSGYLVPAVDGRAVKAVTFSTVKWPHLAAQAPVHVVRCSVGRSGDVAVLQRDDEDLAAVELAEATGMPTKSIAQRVTRWGGGLPQYNVGHLDRVASIRQAVARHPGLAVAGAAYDGVGIPACIATAKSAVAQVTAYLSTRRA
jgi:oxygen-dependent protoporphyrinogen oxidase